MCAGGVWTGDVSPLDANAARSDRSCPGSRRLILWTIAVCMLQSTVNHVAAPSPAEWDARELPTSAADGGGR